jgi:ATP-binding cassette subfamily B protein
MGRLAGRPRRLIRERILLLRLFGALPAGTMTATLALLLVRALPPAATALATGVLVGRLVVVAQDRVGGVAPVLAPVAWFVLLLVTSQAVEHLIEPLRFQVTRRLDGVHRRAVEEVACAPVGIAHLENAGRQDTLLLAAGDPDNWTEGTPGPAAWAMLLLVSRYVSGVLAVLVIARDSIPVAAFLLVSLMLYRSVQRRSFLKVVQTWAAGMPHRRRATYWTSLLTGSHAAKELRLFNLSDWVRQRYDEETTAHLQPFRRMKFADARRQWLWLVIVMVAVGSTIFVLGRLAIDGQLPAGRLVADLSAVALLVPLFSVNDTILDLEAGLPRLLALDSLRTELGAAIATAATPRDRSDAVPTPLVRFEEVRFAYPGAREPVLDGLNLEIRPGEVLALVGLNGAGKTTITRILAGLYEPDAGWVTVDGVDVREFGVLSWRRRLAMVFQDFLRYELSVRDNIALGRSGSVSDEDIRAAAEQAGVTALVEDLPMGWDTPLAAGRTGGVDLSGGQWQRIALARALLAVRTGARLLVLDEPTAHLDVRTEFEVFHQVIQAANGASVVLISHRLSTVREADRIVLLDGGRVAESGTHDELMTLGGTYAQLFRLQAGQFTETVGNAT